MNCAHCGTDPIRPSGHAGDVIRECPKGRHVYWGPPPSPVEAAALSVRAAIEKLSPDDRLDALALVAVPLGFRRGEDAEIDVLKTENERLGNELTLAACQITGLHQQLNDARTAHATTTILRPLPPTNPPPRKRGW